MQKCIVLMLFLVLQGCSSTKTIKTDYVLNSESGKGVFATSISYQGYYSGYSISYQNLTSGEIGNVQFGEGVALIPIPAEGDFSHLNRTGEVFAIELPVGKYRVWNWNVHSGYAHVQPTSPINIEFEVLPGKVTYLGNFDFVQTANFGLTVTGVEVNYSEQSDIDIDILLKKYPRINRDDIFIGIEKTAEYKGLGGSVQSSWSLPPVIL